jgi:hypothetical protein
MIGNAHIQHSAVEHSAVEQINPPSDWQQLARENGSLRVIIAELLIKNQKLRWELLRQRCGPAHDRAS